MSAQEPQATFTGSQQRAGVYALPFAVNGIFGFGRPRAPSRAQQSKKKQKKRRSKEASSGGCGLRFGGGGDEEDELPAGYTFDWDAYRAKFGATPIEDAVTLLFSEYAALYARIAGWTTSATPTPMTLAEGRSISEQATNFLLNIMSPILGYVHTSKVHKLLAHVMGAIKYHGFLSTGNTSSNEAAHKDDKPFYTRTNMNLDTFTQQLVRQAQGAKEIGRTNAAADAEARRTLPVVSSLAERAASSAAAAAAALEARRTLPPLPTLSERAATAAAAAAAAPATAASTSEIGRAHV